MKTNSTQSNASIVVRFQRGVSLIELMVALVIAGLIALGLVQIFGASTATSQMTEGLSRVQESGRFATDFMQRQLRMVGFMGCGPDTNRIRDAVFVNHLAMFDGSVPAGNAYRFQRPLEAFTAGSMTAPAELASEPMVAGSDVLVLRVFSEESVPVSSISKDPDDTSNMVVNLAMPDPVPAILPATNELVLFGMQNCRSADVFAGSLTGSALAVEGRGAPNVYVDISVTNCGPGGCPWDFRISNASLNSQPRGGQPTYNAEIHRAEYYALFVRENPAGIPSLYVLRYERDGSALGDAEELVEGVENLQLRFGVNTGPSDGQIDEYRTAAEVVGAAADDETLDDNWRRVLSVRIGMLIRSPGRAGAQDRTYNVIGLELTPDENDGAIREVYETTISLRNRLFRS